MTRLRFLVLFAIVLGPTTVQAQGTTRDSAGVRIVENSRPAWPRGREWTLSSQPVVDIGTGDDSLYQLVTVMGATRLGDGSIAVASMASGNIRIFNATGRYVRAIGRRGQGPAEFRQVMGLVRRPGDTLAVIDSRDEVEFFTADGTFLRGLRSSRRREGLVVTDFHFFDNGSFVRTTWPQGANRGPGRWLDSLVVIAMSPSDTVGRIISRHPAMEFTKSTTFPFPQPVTFNPGGFIVGAGDAYWVAYADRYEIRRHRLDGSLELIVRAPSTRRAVRDADRERFRNSIINLPSEGGRGVDPRLIEQRRKMMEEVAFTENFPAYSHAITDSDRNLWVSDLDVERFYVQSFSAVSPNPTTWRVFDRAGIWLGTVTMPARFRAMEIGRDYVLGLWKDSDDVEHVRLYRLTKP